MIGRSRVKTASIAYRNIPVGVMARMLLLVGVVCFSIMGRSEAQEGANAAALAQLRGLAGEWEGPFVWTGARTDTGTMHASYYATGNGSAVVENLSASGVLAMTSVYHLDGVDLRMTHFCGAQNQPRLKARQIDVAKGILDFDFVDVTNLRSPDAPHVYGLEMRLLSADHITLTFLFEGGSKQSRELIDLKRVDHKLSAK